jgi:hypothetical protein
MTSPLPQRYQPYVGPAAGPASVELYDEHDPIVHVPDPYDPSRSVAVRRSALQPVAATAPRDLTPQPLIDPLAQRLAAAGVGAGTAGAGVGWGIGQAAAGIATFGGSTAAVVMLALWLLARASRPSVQVQQTVHNHARWFGKNTTNLG